MVSYTFIVSNTETVWQEHSVAVYGAQLQLEAPEDASSESDTKETNSCDSLGSTSDSKETSADEAAVDADLMDTDAISADALLKVSSLVPNESTLTICPGS